MLLSPFQTSLNHFHSHPTSGLVPDLILTVVIVFTFHPMCLMLACLATKHASIGKSVLIIRSMDQFEPQIPPDGVTLRAFPEEEKQGQFLST